MLIGAYGLKWDREAYQWTRVRNRRILGVRKAGRSKVSVADFSNSRGLYLLYRDDELYYVGLTRGYGKMTGRISDHTTDRHAGEWNRFSWFSFDGPSIEVDDDGVLVLADEWDHYSSDLTAHIAIKDFEALLIQVTGPPGNARNERFDEAELWEQVANIEHPTLPMLSDLIKEIA